jgi:hypothetical protein
MTRPTTQPSFHPEALAMLFTDCPLCDRPAPIDGVTGELDCVACGIRLELAPEPIQLDLPLAA